MCKIYPNSPKFDGYGPASMPILLKRNLYHILDS